MTGRNIGDLLNEHHITWGWFQGGFTPAANGNLALTNVPGATTQVAGARPDVPRDWHLRQCAPNPGP